MDPFLKAYPVSSQSTAPQPVLLNVQENLLKRILLYLSVPYIRRHVPTDLHVYPYPPYVYILIRVCM